MVGDKNTKHVPIVTDEKAVLVNAIETEINLYKVGCSRHLEDNTTRWVDAHLWTIGDRTICVEDVMTLTRAESEEECHTLLQIKQEKWSGEIVDYFRTKWLEKVSACGAGNISNVYDYDIEITTNQSEGFNIVIKALQGWQEVQLDAIV